MERPTLHAVLAVALAAGAAASVPMFTWSASMSLDEADRNKQVVRKLYEDCVNPGKLERLAELVADDFVSDQGGSGPSGFAANVEELRAGFPELRFTLHDLVAEGDRVAVRWTWEAKHAGRFRAWAATGKQVRNSGIAIYRLQRGKIAGVSLETDRLGVLQQIGAIPAGLVPAGPPVK